jgi:hypothetical protein
MTGLLQICIVIQQKVRPAGDLEKFSGTAVFIKTSGSDRELLGRQQMKATGQDLIRPALAAALRGLIASMLPAN